MGRKNRGRDHKGSAGSLGSLADVMPEHIRAMTGGSASKPSTPEVTRRELPDSPATRALKSGRVDEIAGYVISGQIDPDEIPSQLLKGVLKAVPEHHGAVSNRTYETIRELQSALRVANENSRGRDEDRVQIEERLRIRTAEARELGQQAVALRGELDTVISDRDVLREQASLFEQELDDLRARLEVSEQGARPASEASMQELLQDLVQVTLPRWLSRREHLLRRAQYVCDELLSMRDRIGDQVYVLKAEIEESELLKSDRSFRSDMEHWNAYLEATERLRRLFEEHQSLRESFEQRFAQREQLLSDYQELADEGTRLRTKIQVLVSAFRLIGEDVLTTLRLGTDFFTQLEEPRKVVELLMSAMELSELDADYQERYEALNSHVIESRAARGVKQPKVGTEPRATAKIHLLPGRIFQETDDELERLILILLHLLYKHDQTQALFAKEIEALLLRSLLVRKRDTLEREVAQALGKLANRRVIRRGSKMVEGTGKKAIAHRIEPERSERLVDETLSQVKGGHTDTLLEHLGRVIPKI